MSTNTFTLCIWLLTVGLLSSCGSGNETSTQEIAEADSTLTDDMENASTIESDLVESNNGETGEIATQDDEQSSDDGSTGTNIGNPQNDDEQTTEQEQVSPEAEGSDSEQLIEDNHVLNFGTAKLLVDLEPNGSSYPAKFHLEGDKLYFWTVDTDPRIANCSSHWGNLGDSDKNIEFNLVATHPETGVVVMNKKIMTLGDFADDANDACAGYNGSIMQIFEHNWLTPLSATGEKQFVVNFDYYNLGPDQVWVTDGSEANTSQQEYGRMEEKLILEGDKMFFVNANGLSVSNTLSGDRRQLFNADSPWVTRQVVKSPARQAAFEIRVGENRYQVWMYNLDTDEWVKKFNIKPDSDIYRHNETLLVDGQTLLTLGDVEGVSRLGFSGNDGDVTSLEILTDSVPTILYADPNGTNNSSNENNNDRLFYTTTEYSAQSRFTSIWTYREQQIEYLFTISESGLRDMRVIAGHDGRIYVAGTRELQPWPDTATNLELWSYDPQTRQQVKLSSDDWYAVKHNHPTRDEGYVFRYLNTPDGLIFVNLKDDSGRELWFTDGTPEGTRQLTDINRGAGSSDPENFFYSGDAIYFSANDGVHDHEPWMIGVSK